MKSSHHICEHQRMMNGVCLIRNFNCSYKIHSFPLDSLTFALLCIIYDITIAPQILITRRTTFDNPDSVLTSDLSKYQSTQGDLKKVFKRFEPDISSKSRILLVHLYFGFRIKSLFHLSTLLSWSWYWSLRFFVFVTLLFLVSKWWMSIKDVFAFWVFVKNWSIPKFCF